MCVCDRWCRLSRRIINKHQDGEKEWMSLWWAQNKVSVRQGHYTCSSGQITENIPTVLRNSVWLKAETSDGAHCKGSDWPLNFVPHVWAGSHLGVALPVTDVFRVCRNWEHSSAGKNVFQMFLTDSRRRWILRQHLGLRERGHRSFLCFTFQTSGNGEKAKHCGGKSLDSGRKSEKTIVNVTQAVPPPRCPEAPL